MKGKRLLLICRVWPESTSSAAGVRDWDFARLFKNAGMEVTVAAPSRVNEFTDALKSEGFRTEVVLPNDGGFDRLLAELRPDIVWYDTFIIEEQFGWRVRDICPDAMQILDTQDLHFLRRARERALKSGASLDAIAECRFELLTEDALRELGSIYRSDLTLVLSDLEKKLLEERFGVPCNLLYLSRFSYDLNRVLAKSSRAPFGQFCFIGNFRHAPNLDGVTWLRDEIWPLIRKELPEAEVHIYGAYVPKRVSDLHSEDIGFLIQGQAKDQIETLSRNRVNLAPLRFGAGIKGKITDGWAAGVPVVTTLVGAEGLHGGMAWGGAVAQKADYFARAAVSLFQEESQWERARENGRAILEKHFDAKKNHPAFLEKLQGAYQRLKERRRENVQGEMLKYHLHDRSKYFSKWIELKNQL